MSNDNFTGSEMIFFKKTALTVATLLLLVSCSGGGSDSANGKASTFAGFSGQVQKGPLIFGSEINVYELDQNLNETGRSFDAQTTDDLGNFAVRAQIQTNIVKMVGVGYYMDELTGGLSAAPITLSAIADLSVDATPTINILTTLATPRILALMQAGTPYATATTQAQREVLAVFGIDSAKINGLQALYAMNINGSNDQDSALLATSAVLSQMATTAALGGSSQAAQLSYFLSRIASDVATNGSLVTASIQTALNNAEAQVNLNTVRTNVQTYYANRGVTIHARQTDVKHIAFEDLFAERVSHLLFRFADGYQPPSMNGTFRRLMRDTGLLKNTEGQTRTLYSLRHTYATFELLNNKTDIHTLSKQMGNSASMIERHYSKLTATMAADRLA